MNFYKIQNTMNKEKKIIYLTKDGQVEFTCPKCGNWYMAYRRAGEVRCRACDLWESESKYEFRVISDRR